MIKTLKLTATFFLVVVAVSPVLTGCVARGRVAAPAAATVRIR